MEGEEEICMGDVATLELRPVSRKTGGFSKRKEETWIPLVSLMDSTGSTFECLRGFRGWETCPPNMNPAARSRRRMGLQPSVGLHVSGRVGDTKRHFGTPALYCCFFAMRFMQTPFYMTHVLLGNLWRSVLSIEQAQLRSSGGVTEAIYT